MGSRQYPVYDTLEVLDGTTIYHTEEWWKAIVLYRYNDGATVGDPEIGIYLWHHDDEEWNRKQKYVIRSQEAWQTDKEVIQSFKPGLEGRSVPNESADANSKFPVSDYYNVLAGETVMQTNDWWKAVVIIDEKGSYESSEVFVYVWQAVEDEWRRRQKYAIKSSTDWKDEVELIEDYVAELKSFDDASSVSSPTSNTTESVEDAEAAIKQGLKERHLSQALAKNESD